VVAVVVERHRPVLGYSKCMMHSNTQRESMIVPVEGHESLIDPRQVRCVDGFCTLLCIVPEDT